jgi:CRISPR/Cas system-associated endoribonuclease Cas2
MNSKNISRTAAIIFSEESSAIKSTTVQRKIIESLFVENDNKELTIDQIIDELKTSLELDFDTEEINSLINDEKKSNFEIRLDNSSKENYLKLENKRFAVLKEREKVNSIFPHIERFQSSVYEGELNTSKLDEILHKYLYELLNKNIQAFKKIAKSSNSTDNLYIDPNLFTVSERLAINQFIEWEDNEKNKAIFALISYSIEYAVINNHYESSDIFLKSIKDKIFYLDNNVLYRAIGINGENRKNRITTFIEKCILAGQGFKISLFTEKEFKETIKHHIKNLQKVPFKRINYRLFSKYSLNPSIYEYYHKWKTNRAAYGFDLFTTHLFSELEAFKKKYNVETVYKIPFDPKAKEPGKRILEYQDEIAAAKGYGYEQSHYFDAINTYLVETLRGQNQNSITDTKYFFVSTDQKLRDWDFARNEFQPIALIPSQWMAILLKYHSRSSNDYSSFLSFLRLKTNTPVIKEDDLQTVLAGISEITEDFEKQESILDKMVELKFDGIMNGDNNPEQIYKKTIDFVSREYEKELEGLNRDRNKAEENFSSEKIQFKENLLNEKQNSIIELSKQKIPIQRQADKRFNRFKLSFSLIVTSYFIILGIITYKVGWETMEPITYFLGVFGIIVTYLYPTIYGKDINPKKYFETKESEISSKVFSEFNFDLSRYEELQNDRVTLKKEIEELRKLHNNIFNK